MIILNLADKTIELNVHEVEGKTLYKAQDLLKGYGFDSKKASKSVSNWVASMKSKLPKFQVVSKEGRGGGTYLDKRNILKLAGYVDYDFEDAVYEAFEAILEGDNNKAMSIAGKAAIDMKTVATTKALWKEYIHWSYTTFDEINKHYGGNLVRMVLQSSLGVPHKASIKGYSNDGVVDRLVSQGHGDAVLSLHATIRLVNKLISSGFYTDKLASREGKKETYAMLKDFISTL